MCKNSIIYIYSDYEIKKIQIIFYTIILNFFLIFSASAQAEKECFEKVSRGIFKFNQGFDNVILEPVAKAYNKLPEPIRNGTGNFTSNIATLLSIPNHLLQGELKSGRSCNWEFLDKYDNWSARS